MQNAECKMQNCVALPRSSEFGIRNAELKQVVVFSKITVFLKLVILSTEPLHLCRSAVVRRI